MSNSLRINRSSPRFPFLLFIVFFILLAGGVVAFYLLFEREKPFVDVVEKLNLLGSDKLVTFTVSDKKSGIRHFDVILRQGSSEKKLYEKNFERQGYLKKAGPETINTEIHINTENLGIKDGAAEIVFTARDFSLWNFMGGNSTENIYPVIFDTQPPKINRMDSSRYITPGGSGIVTYRMSEVAAIHGVRVNDYFHPGYPVPGKDGLYAAIIGLPYDTEKILDAHVEAVDAAGNRGVAPFGMILKNVNFKHDRINIPDSFLDLKIPEFSQYYPEMSGDQLNKYLYVNNDVRKSNNKRIMELCSNSLPEKLWDGRFARMARSSNRAGYADHRTYYYNGKEIDRQVHLGIDLASTMHAEVEAANNGKVIFADYLGIYGNMVIVDHGLGLFSLYSHLSQIGVTAGDILKKGDVLGATGTSGMAGGDHLHFSILVNGILVNPLEWWDQSWIDINIASYLK